MDMECISFMLAGFAFAFVIAVVFLVVPLFVAATFKLLDFFMDLFGVDL